MNKEKGNAGYIYLGEHYDIMGRELNISDKKIGKSMDPITREYSLNRTKSPIGYRIINVYRVDNMDKLEKMLHSILDSRRTYGEWYKDDEDTLTGEFNSFMLQYGAELSNTVEISKENKVSSEREVDDRLKLLASKFQVDTLLIRTYKGVDYEVTLNTDGFLVFNDKLFDTPNKLYNSGIIKFTTGHYGNSGTNQLSQFKIKETGERLKD